MVGAFTLGIGGAVANADSGQAPSTTAEVQPADWHGYGHGQGWDRGYGHDYYRGGWPADRWRHPWGLSWQW